MVSKVLIMFYFGMWLFYRSVQFVKINQQYPSNYYPVCMLHSNRSLKINSSEHIIKVGYKSYVDNLINTFIWNSNVAYTENKEIHPKC